MTELKNAYNEIVEFNLWPFVKSDKGDWHSYIEVYEELFSKKREEPIRLLEIGVLRGSSLVLWANYFKSAIKIVGIDNGLEYESLARSVYPEDVVFKGKSKEEISEMILRCFEKFENIDFHVPMDAYAINTIDALFSMYGQFDIIIDDALHLPPQQSFIAHEYGLKLLAPEGILVVEDVDLSLPNGQTTLPSMITTTSLKYKSNISIWPGKKQSDALLIIKKES